MKRLLRLLPPGTIAVGGGLALLGVASYVHLAVAGHQLSASDMSSLSVLWSIVFTVGPGLFLPIEQEVARLVAARRTRGGTPGPVLARGAAVSAAVLALLIATLVAGTNVIADRLFAGDTGLVGVLIGALATLAVAHTTRGVLSGLQIFGWYGTQLGLDGALRMTMVAVLGVAGVTSPVWYAMVLVIAPLAAVVLTASPVLRAIGAGVPVSWRPFLRGFGLLAVSSLLAQVVVNVGVINVRLLAPSDVVTAGALLSALVLIRIPLFVFASLQASLLPGLSASAAAGDQAAFRLLLRRALVVVTALGVTGAVPGILLGPWLIRALFDAPDVLTRVDFAWLAVATLAYLWAMVLGQALLAQDRHRAQALSWAIATGALVVVTLLPMSVALRVEIAYAAASIAAAASMAARLRRPRTAEPTPAPAELAPPVSGGLR
jgi:O-antigen/teichoic acid export membrane protein